MKPTSIMNKPDTSVPLAHFGLMVDTCYDYTEAAKAQGRPIVGITCEYTPREIILAARGVPVCLCGGARETIPDAERILPANLCPLIKSTFGYHLQRSNPFLEWSDLVVAETTCDGKKKMHLPYLKIETDYSPSDSARLAVRVEAMLETVRSRAGGSAGVR